MALIHNPKTNKPIQNIAKMAKNSISCGIKTPKWD
jgi:hypothetical protein